MELLFVGSVVKVITCIAMEGVTHAHRLIKHVWIV